VCCGGAPRSVLNPPQHLWCFVGVSDSIPVTKSMTKIRLERSSPGPASAVDQTVSITFLGRKSHAQNDGIQSPTFWCFLGLLGLSWSILGGLWRSLVTLLDSFGVCFAVIFRCLCSFVWGVLSRRVLVYFLMPADLRGSEFGLGQTQFYTNSLLSLQVAFLMSKSLQKELF
jgi:hypothetical protein